MNVDKLLKQFATSPFIQSGSAIGLSLLIAIILKLCLATDTGESSGIIFWEFSFSLLLGYMMFNSLFSLQSNDRMIYFRNSIFAFMLLAAVGGCIAWLFSGIKLDEAGSFRWLYIVFTFVYLVFLTIVNLMRKVIDYARKQDNRLRGGK